MTRRDYDPVQLIGDVQAVLRGVGIHTAVGGRLPEVLDAARTLLGALGVPTPAGTVPAPTTRRVTYRMTLVDPAIDVVVEEATAGDRTEAGRVAARWRAANTGQHYRIDVEAIHTVVPAASALPTEYRAVRDDPATGGPLPAGVDGHPLGGRR